MISFIRTTEAQQDRGVIVVRNPKSDEREPPKNFSFDHVFGESVTQKFIYDSCMSQVVDACLEGFNGTIFACTSHESTEYNITSVTMKIKILPLLSSNSHHSFFHAQTAKQALEKLTQWKGALTHLNCGE